MAKSRDPVKFTHSAEEYQNRATYILAREMAALGIRPGRWGGGIAVEMEPIGLLAKEGPITEHEDGNCVATLCIRAHVADHLNGGIQKLRSAQVGLGSSEEEALAVAAREWLQGCLEPLRRATDEARRSEPDASLNHFIEGGGNQQKLFDIFTGPVSLTGLEQDAMPPTFTRNPYDWLASRERLIYPVATFHMVKIYAARQANGDIMIDCALNGEPFAAAERAIRRFPWVPSKDFQSLRFYAALRQVPV